MEKEILKLSKAIENAQRMGRESDEYQVTILYITCHVVKIILLHLNANS